MGGACLVALVIGAEGFWAMIGVGVEAREIVPASRLASFFRSFFRSLFAAPSRLMSRSDAVADAGSLLGVADASGHVRGRS